jgi:hypothetical protein
MSAFERDRLPLVRALPSALRQAERIVPNVVIENEVAAAIRRGEITDGSRPKVYGHGWVAYLRRRRALLSGERPAWVVACVKATPHEEEPCH